MFKPLEIAERMAVAVIHQPSFTVVTTKVLQLTCICKGGEAFRNVALLARQES